MIQPAARTRNYNYAIRNIVVEAKKVEAAGKPVTYLNIGDPVIYGFQPPESLMDAMARAVRDGQNGYAPSNGTVAAREAIAADSEQHGVSISPDDVIVTSGASEAADLVMNALLEPGDDVLTPCPTYPLYTAITAKLGAIENSYRLDPTNKWLPDLDDIRRRITPRTRAIVIINPNNPTGTVYPVEIQRALLELAAEHELLVMADDVYHRMTYGPHAPRLASLAQEMDVPIVSMESLSKSHLVPGWRVGWMTFSNKKKMAELIPAVRKIADARLCSPLPTQAVIPHALSDLSHLQTTMDEMKLRANISVEAINAIPGMNCARPEAAFYLIAQMENLAGATDEEFVLALLRETGILFVYGSGFGLEPRDGYFRIVFLPEPDVLRNVYAQLSSFVEAWPHRARQAAQVSS